MGRPLHSTAPLALPRRPLWGLPAPVANNVVARLRHVAGQHLGMAITLALLAALCALQVLALLRAPAAWLPAAIHIAPVAGRAVVRRSLN